MSRIRFASGLMAAALALSCGGGGGGGSTATEFISSYCDFVTPCCAKAKLKADGQQCKLLLTAFAPANYNPTAGQACLSELQAASTKPDFCQSALDGPSCDAAFPQSSKGTRKPGEVCTQDGDCASSPEGKVECQHLFRSGTEVRKCQLQVTGKEGDQPCVGTVERNGTSVQFVGGDDIPARGYLCRVADGLYCDVTTQVCTRFKAVGETCSQEGDCGPSAFCDGYRNCAARKNVGEPCIGTRDECADGAFCQATTMTCAARLGDGAACMDSDACKSSSCVNGKCAGDVPADLGLAFLCGS
jgi:hypothetical protein